MREQITFDLPKRIGALIDQGIVKHILVKTGHRDIKINISEDKEFFEEHEHLVDHSIHVTLLIK